MCAEAISVPDGLKTGPIFVDGEKLPKTGNDGLALNIFPAADGVQHCEVAGMRDALDAYAAKLPKWGWLQRLAAGQNWETKVRVIDPEDKVDPTVIARAGLPAVVQCAAVGPYRPESLRNHNDFKQPADRSFVRSQRRGFRFRSRCGPSGSTDLAQRSRSSLTWRPPLSEGRQPPGDQGQWASGIEVTPSKATPVRSARTFRRRRVSSLARATM